MGTVYLTANQLETVVGSRHLAVAAPGADPDSYDAGAVDAAISAVSDMVDARLRARYAIPLEDVPEFLRRAVARLVHHELVDEPASTELIESRAREAMKVVDGLGSGKLQIGGDADGDGEGNQRTRQGRAAIHTPSPRRFRRGNTSGIV